MLPGGLHRDRDRTCCIRIWTGCRTLAGRISAIVPASAIQLSAQKRDLIADAFAAWLCRRPPHPPADRDAIGSTATVARQFVDTPRSRQIHVRSCRRPVQPGAAASSMIAPGSSEAEPKSLIARAGGAILRRRARSAGVRRIGSRSGPKPTDRRCSPTTVAAALLDDDRRRSVRRPLYGIGFGSSVALAFVECVIRGGSVALALQGLSCCRMPVNAPTSPRSICATAIAIAADGGHWYRHLADAARLAGLLAMVRPAAGGAAAGGDADFAARPLHRCDDGRHARARRRTGDLIACLRWMTMPPKRSRTAQCRSVWSRIVTSPQTPLSVHDDRFAATVPRARRWWTAADPDFAAVLASFVAEL